MEKTPQTRLRAQEALWPAHLALCLGHVAGVAAGPSVALSSSGANMWLLWGRGEMTGGRGLAGRGEKGRDEEGKTIAPESRPPRPPCSRSGLGVLRSSG